MCIGTSQNIAIIFEYEAVLGSKVHLHKNLLLAIHLIIM